MTTSPNALCFGDRFPATGQPCYVEMSPTGLTVRFDESASEAAELTVPFSALSVSAGGLNHDQLVVKWRAGAQTYTLYLKDPDLIRSFRASTPPELTRDLEKTAAKVRHVRSRQRTVWSIVLGAGVGLVLEDLSRNASVHAAGVVIGDQPLVNLLPLKQDEDGGIVTQYAMGPVGDLGMLKMDFLGLKTLTVIRNACDLVRRTHGIEVTALHNHFFFDSPKVMFMHIGGMGQPDTLATAVGKVFARIKETSGGAANPPTADIDPAKSTITAAKVDEIVGQKGELASGVYKLTIGRSTRMHGHEVGKTMGVNTWAAFAGFFPERRDNANCCPSHPDRARGFRNDRHVHGCSIMVGNRDDTDRPV